MKKILPVLALISLTAFSQPEPNPHQQILIEFPELEGIVLLKCDLHIHTVFSDGHVWPSIRVQEAQKDGLDVIAITDHLEYQPHKEDIPHPDRNRSYEIASDEAGESELLVIHGSEITRDMPPGHSNAIFITDANKLLMDDPMDVFREAGKQDAFVFWNHPNWPRQKPDAIAELTEMHKTLIEGGLLHGIEVVNGGNYSDEAFQIALDNNLALIGTSDVHGLVDWDYHKHPHAHRPITLVFAKARTKASMKEALKEGRTAVYYNHTIIGRERELQPLLKASITIAKAEYQPETTVLNVTLKNNSSSEFILRNTSEYTLNNSAQIVVLKPHAEKIIEVKTIKELNELSLSFEVLNVLVSPGAYAEFVVHTQKVSQ